MRDADGTGIDSKVLDDDGFDGQITLGEDTFYQKYEQQILRLTGEIHASER